MSIRILPLFKYPFDNTQQQIFDDELFEQGKASSTFHASSINSTFQRDVVDYTDRTILNNSPDIKGHAPLGESSFEIDLSLSSFSSYFSDNDIYNIKFLVFFLNHSINSNKRNKYFYYVERITRKNAHVYTFNLSIDVFKTYYEEIINMEGVVPERYFIKYDDLDERILKYDDILQPLPPEIIEYPLAPKIYDGFDYSEGNIIWEYMYFKTGNDSWTDKDATFLNDGYFIIALPKHQYKDNSDMELINVMKKSDLLIKSVMSVIPPFPFNRAEDESMLSGFEYDQQNNWIKMGEWSNDVFNTNWKDIGVYTGAVEGISILNNQLLQFIKDNIDDYSIFKNYFIPLIFRNNHVGYELVEYSDGARSWPSFLQYNFNHSNINIRYKDEPRFINKLYDNIEISFLGEPSLPIKREMRSSRIYIRLKHSLLSTKEEIYNFINDKHSKYYDRDYKIERIGELTSTITTDTYANYLLNNKNALTQKEHELFEYEPNKIKQRDRFNIATNIISVGASVAGTIATGGLLAPSIAMSGVGLARSGYNALENKSNLVMKQQQFTAEMNDKRNEKNSYSYGEFVYNDINDFLPYVKIYNYVLTDRGTNVPDSDEYDENLKDNFIVENYALFYPFNKSFKVSDLITRNKYNYIQAKDVSLMKNNYDKGIPSIYFTFIKELFLSGIQLYSKDFKDSDLRNNEEV